MKSRNLVLIVILAAILILGGCGCGSYNSLVQQDESVKNSWNKVQSDYQRRADLIPNLVNTVKGEASFERGTLTDVINARASATQIKVDPNDLTPEKVQQFQAAQSQLSQALGRLLAVSEAYPNLRANDAFRGLQAQLEGTENRIKTSRNDFNDQVQAYNTKVRSFPTNIFAGIMGFRPRQGFTADAGADRAPQVQF
jgi:LemA protein